MKIKHGLLRHPHHASTPAHHYTAKRPKKIIKENLNIKNRGYSGNQRRGFGYTNS
jgi:ribosomal protein L13E